MEMSLLNLARQQDHLPMRLPYGQRYNEATGRLDAPDAKGFGFFGPIALANGDVASEYSASAPINGRTVSYPSVAQNMPKELLAQVLMAAQMHAPVPQPAADFAYDSALARLGQGKSPFFDPWRDPWPKWSPEQYWP